jgi:hypothetical protein
MANFELLQAKYQPVIDLGKTRGVSWKNIHLDPNLIKPGQKLKIPE